MPEDPLRSKRQEALENWRRVRLLFKWTDADETRSRNDRQLLIFLERCTRGAPLAALARASLGHAQGAGRLRRRSAEAIVAPLLAIAYPEQEHCTFRQSSYPGPASPAFLAYLRGLSELEHFDLAEHWIAYLRRERSDLPSTWQAPRATQVESEPRDELELALLEVRLVRLEVAGERLKAELERAGRAALIGDADLRRSRWLHERRALLEQCKRVRTAPTA